MLSTVKTVGWGVKPSRAEGMLAALVAVLKTHIAPAAAPDTTEIVQPSS